MRELARCLLACSAGALMLLGTLPRCTPEVIVQKVPPPPHPSERYLEYHAENVGEEALRLEAMLLDTASLETDSTDSTALSREDILTRLFELSIHRSNLAPDYHKAYSYAAVLYKTKTSDKLYYLNWGRVLSEYIQVLAEKDSLALEVEDAAKQNRSLRYSSRKKDMRVDSLNLVIKDQKDKIEKLKKLDLTMERQRSNIP